MRVITNSAVRCYRTCARQYYYQYQLGYRPVAVASALSFGKLIHEALEVWWRMADSENRLENTLRVIQSAPALSTNTVEDEVEKTRAEEIIRGYHYRWLDMPYETIAVESTFQTDLVNPETAAASRTFCLGGKIDAIIRRGHDTWICEHKTSGENIEPGSVYWQKLRLDQQISTYFVGARSLGIEPVGCIYDVLGKPKIDLLQATPTDKRKYTKAGVLYANQRDTDESIEDFRSRLRNEIADNPEKYYQRGEVVRFNAEETEAAFDIWQTAKLIMESVRMNRWPRNSNSCFWHTRACDFWPVCSSETTLEDTLRYRHADEANEELTTNKEAKHESSKYDVGF